MEGEHRVVLLNKAGEIVGVNIWDENWMNVNFRYSIVRPEPFLADYMRLLFYTDRRMLARAQNGIYVNDGGVLDRPSLKQYKDKLNPLRVREVRSWSRI